MGKLHIVGGGAIGSLIAASAQKNGVPYDCYPRDMKTMPSCAHWQNGQTTALKPAKPSPIVLPKSDVLIIPLKVYQLKAALIVRTALFGPYQRLKKAFRSLTSTRSKSST